MPTAQRSTGSLRRDAKTSVRMSTKYTQNRLQALCAAVATCAALHAALRVNLAQALGHQCLPQRPDDPEYKGQPIMIVCRAAAYLPSSHVCNLSGMPSDDSPLRLLAYRRGCINTLGGSGAAPFRTINRPARRAHRKARRLAGTPRCSAEDRTNAGFFVFRERTVQRKQPSWPN